MNILAQAKGGKQGVLGPTKIYLAVQPSVNATSHSESSTKAGSSTQPSEKSSTPSPAKKLKVILSYIMKVFIYFIKILFKFQLSDQQVNGQLVETKNDANSTPTSSNKFVLTPDYIQQSTY